MPQNNSTSELFVTTRPTVPNVRNLFAEKDVGGGGGGRMRPSARDEEYSRKA